MNKEQNAALEAERVAFDKWFRCEQMIADHIDTTFISSAFLPYRAWQARAQLAAPAGVVLPSENAVMRVVLREMGGSRHIRGTSNWCADVGVAVLNEVRRLNAAAPSPAPASEVWMIPTVKQLEQALDSVPSFHDLSAELIAPAMLEHLRSVITTGEYGDPYQGAREDLAIWKRRALEAETKIREQDQIIENLGNALNAENGPTFMGEPVLKPASADHVEEARHMVSGVPVYQLQCREIGEGDWCPADLRHYTYCQKSPEMDTRIVEVEPASDVVQVPRELLEILAKDAGPKLITARRDAIALLNGGRV
jgi:hypothetical protein